jgi:type II secretory pathway pseudopilin PulG
MKPVTHKILWRLTLTVLLLGAPAALIVPNVVQAVNRSRQKQTMADMRTIATAWEAFATDRDEYTVDVFRGPAGSMDDVDRMEFDRYHRVSYADLRRTLQPKYIGSLPTADAWGSDLEFRTADYNSKGRAMSYAIRSLGSDRRAEPGPYKNSRIVTYEQDLVLSQGNFITYPEGT